MPVPVDRDLVVEALGDVAHENAAASGVAIPSVSTTTTAGAASTAASYAARR